MATLLAWKPADLFLYAAPVFENYPQFCARIYRSSFGRENDRFRENKPKTLIFSPILTQRRRS